MNSKELHWRSQSDFFVTYPYFDIFVVRSRRILWNLLRFTIILLMWSQFIAVSHSDCKIVTSSLSVFAKLQRALSSIKLWTDVFWKKKIIEKNVKQNLSKNWALEYTRYNCIELALFVIYFNTVFAIF